jgi:secreted trypsin-like serine protease
MFSQLSTSKNFATMKSHMRKVWRSLVVIIVIYESETSAILSQRQKTRSKKSRVLRPLEVKPATRVIGGVDAQQGRYPYNVALVDGFGRLICGGTLIAPDVVLTVSHCEGMTRVQIGRYDMTTSSDNFDDLQIVFQIKHPFNTGYGPYEFNLLKLSASSTKPYIKLNGDPGLPRGDIENEVTAMGFGVIRFTDAAEDGYELASFLQEVDLRYVPNKECEKSKDPDHPEDYMKWGYQGLITDDMMCAIGKGDACMGDSGA